MKTYSRMLRVAAVAVLLAPVSLGAAKTSVLTSPDGKIAVEVRTSGGLSYTVSRNGKTVFSMSDIALALKDIRYPMGTPKVGRPQHVQRSFQPVVPMKFSTITKDYNEARISMGSGVTVLLRVMNDGVAHRFVLSKRGEVEVNDESYRFIPAKGFTAHRQSAASNFNTSFEEAYRHETLKEWNASDRKTTTIPLLLSGEDDTQLLLGQSDVDDYPHQFLTTDGEAIKPVYPKSPLRWEPRGDRSEAITEEAHYIAKTSGQRALPWRWVAVTDSKGIIEQTLPVQLARRNVLDDTSWILPGKVSWEWWNGAAPFGPDVDFKAGCNYETYCYFADFAAKFGIEYILLDEGWAKDTRDPFHGNDHLRLQELIGYCKQKGVKVMLWLPWLTAQQHLGTLFKTYAEWGIPAVKIDFMDHADQWMVNFYKRVVQEAAKYKIIVDFHGAFTPSGLEQEYPNLISYEGIRGLEQMGGCRPENTTYLPFIRNVAGAADFTPGGMNNMQPDRYRADRPNSGAMGTRCFQMALYVVLESGVQMLSDSPTRYYQSEDCTRYIAIVPTTWDETRCLAAEAGQYVVVARRKGRKWFLGGITNNTPRDFDLRLDFLDEGSHRMTAFRDGVNADYQAMHYNSEERSVDRSSVVHVHMARNGGWAAVIE